MVPATVVGWGELVVMAAVEGAGEGEEHRVMRNS